MPAPTQQPEPLKWRELHSLPTDVWRIQLGSDYKKVILPPGEMADKRKGGGECLAEPVPIQGPFRVEQQWNGSIAIVDKSGNTNIIIDASKQNWKSYKIEQALWAAVIIADALNNAQKPNT